jgi:hypothetical protein
MVRHGQGWEGYDTKHDTTPRLDAARYVPSFGPVRRSQPASTAYKCGLKGVAGLGSPTDAEKPIDSFLYFAMRDGK